MKEFDKFIWRTNKKGLISISRYTRKTLCKCMRFAIRRHKSHVQKEKFPVKVLSKPENA